MKTPKSFEAGMARLEEILAQISDETTPLADAVKLYAEAAELMAACSAALNTAQLQIEEIDAKIQTQMPKEQTHDGADV
jgi:exodeoxyribonuclease VII small subunit